MRHGGVYEIVNLVNGKRYVGSAARFEKRWKEHRRALQRGVHHSPALQRAWRKYGADSFRFSVIEKCEGAALIEREQFAFDILMPEYNVCRVAGSTLGVRKSEEAKAKLRAANLGKAQPIESRKARCTLSDDIVRRILELRASGASLDAVGREFRVKRQLVGKICLRERYEWVAPDIILPPLKRKGRRLPRHSAEASTRHAAAGRARWLTRKAAGLANPKHLQPRTEEQRARIAAGARAGWDRRRLAAGAAA